MRTVIATSFTPTLDSGRARRTYGVVAALARHGEVDLVYGRFGADRPDHRFEALPDITFHAVDRPGQVARLPAYLRARSRGIPDDFARGIWPGIPAAGGEADRRSRLRAGADRRRGAGGGRRPAAAGGAPARLLLRPQPRVLVPSPARRKRHVAGGAGALRAPAAGALRGELDGLRGRHDGRRGARSGGRAAAGPQRRRRRRDGPVDPRGGQRAIAFVADLGYEPNRDGLAFLLEEAMPEVWRRAADVELRDRRQGQRRDRGRPTRGSSHRASSTTSATSMRRPAR